MTKWLGPLAIILALIILVAMTDEVLNRGAARLAEIETSVTETTTAVQSVEATVLTLGQTVQAHATEIEDHERRLTLLEKALDALLVAVRQGNG